jgi:hypothetical protein
LGSSDLLRRVALNSAVSCHPEHRHDHEKYPHHATSASHSMRPHMIVYCCVAFFLINKENNPHECTTTLQCFHRGHFHHFSETGGMIQMPTPHLFHVRSHATQTNTANITRHHCLEKFQIHRIFKHTIQITSKSRANGRMQVQGQDAVNQGELNSAQQPNMQKVRHGQPMRQHLQQKYSCFENGQSNPSRYRPSAPPLKMMAAPRITRQTQPIVDLA